MKTKALGFAAALVLTVVGPALQSPAAAAEPGHPRIESIELAGRFVVVQVQVPAGLRKLTLESRARVGAGAWVPRVVERLDGRGGTLTFRLPATSQLELLRVRGDASEPLPAAFYAGAKAFAGPASAFPQVNVPFGRSDAWESGAPAPEAGGDTRTVVESDIWRVRGDTLYFFNQYRGLQVIQLAPPEAPAVRATLPLPAAGEQMYVVTDPDSGADRVVLLARNGCNGWGSENNSQILIVDPASPETSGPGIVGGLELPGYIQESRLVGTALYVASQTYRVVTVPPRSPGAEALEQWEYGTQITSFDLTDPDAPRRRDSLWFAGYGHTIQATDRFLFVVLNDPANWWQTVVRLVDISAPDGALQLAGSVRPAGHVADKFKLHLDGHVFTVVSEVSRWLPTGRQVSVLETFSVENPLEPRKLGELEVGHGEGLYATRFDGQRAYLVTFLRIDPLWVVDLRDPAQPKISGELEVPGWSTYIHPLGDRLVTIGIDNANSWRVAVSLFDVRDPARPALLSRVPLGENNSWSEATHDEKAFTVLPDAGLILVPYQSWGENGQAARVQLIDLAADSLTARGVIEHAFQPRRATVHGERILSVSGREFLSVDARDRDQPVVAAQLELSWPVDAVLPVGGHLLELAGAAGWFDRTAQPVIRVASASAPDEVLRRVALPAGQSVLGAATAGSVLYVVQSSPGEAPAPPPGEPPVIPPDRLRVTSFDLSRLPELTPLGAMETEVASLGWGGQFKALWPRPGLLVLAGQGGGFGWWGGPIGFWEGDAAVPGRLWWPVGMGGRLLALDVADAAAPKLVSDLNLAPGVNGWFDGETFAADGLIFLSHQASEFLEGVTLPGQPPPQPYEVTLPDGTRHKVTPPPGVWVTRYFLDVVDYADPATPTVRPAANLPGRLVGMAAGGALLFTAGPHWNEQGQSDGVEYLDASAYDGVSVSLIASLKQPAEWPRALAVDADGVAFVARPAKSPATGGAIEAWRLTDAGTFLKLTETVLPEPAGQLKPVGTLLAAQAGAAVQVFQKDAAGTLTLVGQARPPGCFWPDLARVAARPGQALWVPLGEYGLLAVPLTPAP